MICLICRVESPLGDGVADGPDAFRHFSSRTLVSFAPRKVTLFNVFGPTRSGPMLVHDPSSLRFHSAQLSTSDLP